MKNCPFIIEQTCLLGKNVSVINYCNNSRCLSKKMAIFLKKKFTGISYKKIRMIPNHNHKEKIRIINFIKELCRDGNDNIVSVLLGEGIGDEEYPSKISANGVKITLALFAEVFGIPPNTKAVLSFLKKREVSFEILPGSDDHYKKFDELFMYRWFFMGGVRTHTSTKQV